MPALLNRNRMVLRDLLVAAASLLVLAVGALESSAAQEKPLVEVVAQFGHSSFVYSVAFSPDGRSALSSSPDNTLRLWDVATGSLLNRSGLIGAGHSRPAAFRDAFPAQHCGK
jgi:WD40 repeat protein